MPLDEAEKPRNEARHTYVQHVSVVEARENRESAGKGSPLRINEQHSQLRLARVNTDKG